MERVKEIVNDSKEISEKIFHDSKELFLNDYQKNKEKYMVSLMDTIRNLFMEAYLKQEDGQKNAVCIIGFFYLNSSLLTGSHKYLIGLYDEAFYLDQNDVSRLYCPDFIIPYFQSDIQLLESNMGKKYVRIKNYEMMQIQFLHIQKYYELMKRIFCDALNEIKKIPEFYILKKSESPLFLYGGYRDYAINLEDSDATFSNRG